MHIIMKKLTKKDVIDLLSNGDTIHKFQDGVFRRYTFVSKHPELDNYIILCSGTTVECIWINHIENTIQLYVGKYDSSFVGELYVSYYESKIKRVKKVHKL